MTNIPFSNEQIIAYIDRILKVAGSAFRHHESYSKENLIKEMQTIIAEITTALKEETNHDQS